MRIITEQCGGETPRILRCYLEAVGTPDSPDYPYQSNEWSEVSDTRNTLLTLPLMKWVEDDPIRSGGVSDKRERLTVHIISNFRV